VYHVSNAERPISLALYPRAGHHQREPPRCHPQNDAQFLRHPRLPATPPRHPCCTLGVFLSVFLARCILIDARSREIRARARIRFALRPARKSTPDRVTDRAHQAENVLRRRYTNEKQTRTSARALGHSCCTVARTRLASSTSTEPCKSLSAHHRHSRPLRRRSPSLRGIEGTTLLGLEAEAADSGADRQDGRAKDNLSQLKREAFRHLHFHYSFHFLSIALRRAREISS